MCSSALAQPVGSAHYENEGRLEGWQIFQVRSNISDHVHTLSVPVIQKNKQDGINEQEGNKQNPELQL